MLHDFYLQLMIILIGFQSSIAIATLAKNIHPHILDFNSNLSYLMYFQVKNILKNNYFYSLKYYFNLFIFTRKLSRKKR